MESYLIVAGVSMAIGVIWGRKSTRLIYENSFKKFTDEMHQQYLYLLEKHGIKKKEN